MIIMITLSVQTGIRHTELFSDDFERVDLFGDGLIESCLNSKYNPTRNYWRERFGLKDKGNELNG